MIDKIIKYIKLFFILINILSKLNNIQLLPFFTKNHQKFSKLQRTLLLSTPFNLIFYKNNNFFQCVDVLCFTTNTFGFFLKYNTIQNILLI